jgi:predicted MFS family arabinose efflux permease
MRSRAPPSAAWVIVDRTAFSDVPYLLLNLGLVFGFMGLYIVLYYIQLFSLDRTDISRGLSNYLLVIINGCSLLGRTVPGYYADKIGSINVQTMAALIGAILTFCLLAIHTAAALVAYCVLIGICAGTFMGLPAAGVVTLSVDKSKIGTRLGMTLATVGVGVLVGNPIAGAIVGGDRNWVGLVCWCGALLIASTVSLVACRVVKIGPGLTQVL